jgi:GNAT superfamily N-acetyltransferase
MTEVRVSRFDPRTADEEELVAYHRVSVASRAVDLPGEKAELYGDFVDRLHNPFPGLGDAVHWLARVGHEVVGFVYVRFPEEENAHIGLVEVVVIPDARRRGLGTEVLRAVLPDVADRNRSTVEGWNVVEGGPGELWCRSLGFRAVRAVVVQQLVLADIYRKRWPAGLPDGYRLVRWTGAAPEGIIASYARARSAIRDAPTGETEFTAPEWTVDKVREAEAEMVAQGAVQRVVAAVREDDGQVAGLTEMIMLPHRTDECYQGDTAVLAAHRGKGLGMCLKADMARWLMSGVPTLERIETMTNADNTHMLRINDQFGFSTLRVEYVLASGVDELAVACG